MGLGLKNPSGGTVQYTNVTLPYVGGSTQYGASAADSIFVDCEGAITTIWDWIPDTIPNPDEDAQEDADPSNDTIPDPLDTPPEWVISQEACTAAYLGYFVLGGDFEGNCDNGLGFASSNGVEPHFVYDPEGGQTLVGYSYYGISVGTLYTRRAGGATITLTCTPTASTTVSGGICSASVSYASRIIVPTINLLGTTRAVAPHAIKFLTGQRINSTLFRNSGPHQPPEQNPLTIDPASYAWNLDGSPVDEFKEYIFTDLLGQLKPLTPTDKDDPAFNFYTNLGGTTKVVCDFKFLLPIGARFEGGLPDFRAESKEIESVRPGFVIWRVRDGTVALFSDRFQFAGDGDSSNGQQWFDAEYMVPAPFGQVGLGCFVQLITADRHLHRTVTNPSAYTHFIKDPWNAQQALDAGYPYAFGAVWNVAGKGTGYDSPSQPLGLNVPYTNQWISSTASDTFETWAMYRPPSQENQPTTWIPMAKYTWRWQGTATFENNAWVLTAASGAKDDDPDGTEDHPTWNKFSPSPFGFLGIP
jgi:hypothetical protein